MCINVHMLARNVIIPLRIILASKQVKRNKCKRVRTKAFILIAHAFTKKKEKEREQKSILHLFIYEHMRLE